MSIYDSYIEVARVVKAHGIRGQLKLLPYTESASDLTQYDSFWIGVNGEMIGQFKVERLQAVQGSATVKFAGIHDRNDAERFRDFDLYIHKSQLPAPPAGQYYIRDLIGLQVVSEGGAELGVLNDVYELPANDVYQIVRDGKELLIPAIEGVVLGIQMDKRVMTVRLPEGLSDTDL